MKQTNFWPKLLKGIQAILFFAVILFATATVVCLLAFDTVIGAYFWDKRIPESNGLFFSMSTTGLTIALGIIYMVTKEVEGKTTESVFLEAITAISKISYVISWIAWAIDVYLDSLSGDYLVYNGLVSVISIWQTGNHVDATVHTVIRVLISTLSMVGEPLALFVIAGVSVITSKISSISGNIFQENTPRYSTSRPATSQSPVPSRPATQPVNRPTSPVPSYKPPTPVVKPQQQQHDPTYHPVTYVIPENKPVPALRAQRDEI